MIVFLEANTFEDIVKDGSLDPSSTVVFNLCSLKQGYNFLDILPRQYLYNPDPNYKVVDQVIINYIYSQDNVFYEFFSKVIYPFYSGADVYILITNQEPVIYAVECIMKIIQGRYGYTPLLINEAEDLYEMNTDVTLPINGIYNLDQDKIRYVGLSAQQSGIPNDFGSDSFENHADNTLRW